MRFWCCGGGGGGLRVVASAVLDTNGVAAVSQNLTRIKAAKIHKDCMLYVCECELSCEVVSCSLACRILLYLDH